jgi:hypothetical protein
MAVVGSLQVELGSNVRGFIDGMKKGQFAFEQSARKFARFENTASKSVDRLVGLNTKISNFANNISSSLTSISKTGINVDASPILSSLGMISSSAQGFSTDIDTVINSFVDFKNIGTTALTAVSTAAPVVGKSLLAVTGPIGLVVGGIGAIAVAAQKFDFVAESLADIRNFFTRAYNSSETFRTGVEGVVFYFRQMGNTAIAAFKILKSGLFTVGRLIRAVFDPDISIADVLNRGLEDSKQAARDWAKVTNENLEKAVGTIQANVKIKDFTKEDIKNISKSITNPFQSAVSEGVANSNFDLLKETEKRIEKNLPKLRSSLSRQVQKTFFDPSTGIFKNKISFETAQITSNQPNRLIREGTTASIASTEVADSINPRAETSNQIFKETSETISNIISKYSLLNDKQGSLTAQAQELNRALAEAADNGLNLSDQGVRELQSQLIGVNKEIADLQAQSQLFGPSFDDMALQMATSLQAGAQSFQAFGKSALSSMSQVIGGLIKTFVAKQILASVGSNPFGFLLSRAIGGLASTAISSAIGSVGAPPALATGGIAYGDTLARVGEYKGVRSNPEVIAPLDKLQQYMPDGGGGSVDVNLKGVRLGPELLLVNEEQSYLNSRLGG